MKKKKNKFLGKNYNSPFETEEKKKNPNNKIIHLKISPKITTYLMQIKVYTHFYMNDFFCFVLCSGVYLHKFYVQLVKKNVF